ncbi:tyrosine-protein phosphatase [Mesobacterium pallidum]|uniref:phosphatase domain-containing protein n=1 Tax=Mesobacterium pallidum TaxID=2872037 RepID=UPI001EE25621|nr:tyrosine-protein phosphatase [Mesobacterium pallidum]
MLATLMDTLDRLERRIRKSFGRDMETRAGRAVATLHFHLMDHHILRVPWTNMFQIAPGVWRSNQPGPMRMKRLKRMGIATIVNLRGEEDYPHFYFERESAEALGITLVNRKLRARTLMKAENFLDVIDALRTADKPLLFHCKSGADRAGIVAAIYLLVFENAPVEVAKKQLGLRYIHLKFTKTGVQDYMLEVYGHRTARDPIGFEDWLRTEYDHKALQAAFDARIPARDMA